MPLPATQTVPGLYSVSQFFDIEGKLYQDTPVLVTLAGTVNEASLFNADGSTALNPTDNTKLVEPGITAGIDKNGNLQLYAAEGWYDVYVGTGYVGTINVTATALDLAHTHGNETWHGIKTLADLLQAQGGILLAPPAGAPSVEGQYRAQAPAGGQAGIQLEDGTRTGTDPVQRWNLYLNAGDQTLRLWDNLNNRDMAVWTPGGSAATALWELNAGLKVDGQINAAGGLKMPGGALNYVPVSDAAGNLVLGPPPGGGGSTGTGASIGTIVGDGVTTTWTLTHNLGLPSPFVPLWDMFLPSGTDLEEKPAVSALATNTMTVTFGVAPPNGQAISWIISSGGMGPRGLQGPPGPTAGVTVLGASNGTDDTSWINAVLTGAPAGSVIRGTAGQTYRISAPLTMRVGGQQTLDMTGCTIIFANTSVRTNMLNNGAVAPASTATDVTTTAGTSVITSPQLIAAGAAVGHSVGVVGAGPSNPTGGNTARMWYYGSIQSISGNNITLGGMYNYASWNPNQADIGLTNATAYLYTTRDADVTVIGGSWNLGTNWNVSADRYNAAFNSDVLRFRRCDGLTVRDVKMGIDYGYVTSGLGWVFGIAPGDCTKILIENIRNIPGMGSPTFVNSSGMIQKCIVRNIQGTSFDDMVAFGTVGAAGDDIEGDIGDLLIDGVHAAFGGPPAWAGKGSNRGVDLYSGKGGNGQYRVIWGFEIRSVKGPYNNWPVSIVTYPAVAGQVGNFLGDLKDISGFKIGGGPAVYIGRADGTNAGLNNGLDCVGTITGPNTGADLQESQLVANTAFGPARGDLATPLSVTFTAPPSGVVWLEAYAYSIQNGNAVGSVLAFITDSAGNIVQQWFGGSIAAAGFTNSPHLKVRLTGLVSGTSYTYKMQASCQGSAGSVLAASTFPAWLKATAA